MFMRMQRIEDLERAILTVESDKRMGRREIDAADAEVRQLRKEIAELKRKYINWFYYF